MIPGSANPLLLATAAAGGYSISRSVRFNSSDSAYLSRVFTSTGNRRTWTLSTWVKRSKLGTTQNIFQSSNESTADEYLVLNFDSSDRLFMGGGPTTYRLSSARFRDVSAWYHILLQWDTTQATASNRVRLYVNGSQLTTFDSSSDPSQNFDGGINRAKRHSFGVEDFSSGVNFLDAYLADAFFIDGQALDPTSFGEFSATTGVWMPKAYTGTYGTNGFKLNFSDNSTAAALGTDSSGAGNTWTVNNISVQAGNGNYIANLYTSSTSTYNGSATDTNFYNGGIGTRINGFDGNLSTVVYSADVGGGWLYFRPSVPLSSVTQLRVYASYVQEIKINGTTATVSPSLPATSTQWYTITSPPSTITEVAIQGHIAQGAAGRFQAIEVNGVVLVDYRAGAGNDSLVDVPTNGSEVDTGLGNQVRGNYCTWNPLKSTVTLSNGNLDGSAGGGWFNVAGTIAVTSGKWYWEVTMNTSTYVTIGVATPEASLSESYGSPTSVWVYDGRGTKQGNGSGNAGSGTDTYGASYGAGDVIGVALDMDNGTLTFYKNNTSQGTAFSTGLSGKTITPWHGLWSSSSSTNWGARPFAYTAPSGFKALCTANLPAPVITKPTTVFDALTFTATNTNNTVVTGLGFQPSLVWGKSRTNAYDHQLYDAVRGVNKSLISNNTNAELSETVGVTSFNSNGFTAGRDFNAIYGSGASVAWCWDAGSSTVTNTQGSISSQVRANASAGFSIVSFSGTVNTNQTVGHGLGVAPSMIIFKNRTDGTQYWTVYHASLGNTKGLVLNGTDAAVTYSGYFNNTTPTSTVFSVGSPSGITNGSSMIAYCFAPVAGYSAMSSFVGNGSSDGVFVYTGFRPRFLLMKSATTATNWFVHDAARSSYNAVRELLFSNLSNAEDASNTYVDFLSNGFKLRFTNTDYNTSGQTYIYYAVAESPFQYARAR